MRAAKRLAPDGGRSRARASARARRAGAIGDGALKAVDRRRAARGQHRAAARLAGRRCRRPPPPRCRRRPAAERPPSTCRRASTGSSAARPTATGRRRFQPRSSPSRCGPAVRCGSPPRWTGPAARTPGPRRATSTAPPGWPTRPSRSCGAGAAAESCPSSSTRAACIHGLLGAAGTLSPINAEHLDAMQRPRLDRVGDPPPARPSSRSPGRSRRAVIHPTCSCHPPGPQRRARAARRRARRGGRRPRRGRRAAASPAIAASCTRS